MVISFFAITQLFFTIKTLMYFSFILTTTVLSLSFFLPYFCHFSVFSASFLSAQRLFPLLRFTSLFVTLFTFCFTSLFLLRSFYFAHYLLLTLSTLHQSQRNVLIVIIFVHHIVGYISVSEYHTEWRTKNNPNKYKKTLHRRLKTTIRRRDDQK